MAVSFVGCFICLSLFVIIIIIIIIIIIHTHALHIIIIIHTTSSSSSSSTYYIIIHHHHHHNHHRHTYADIIHHRAPVIVRFRLKPFRSNAYSYYAFGPPCRLVSFVHLSVLSDPHSNRPPFEQREARAHRGGRGNHELQAAEARGSS